MTQYQRPNPYLAAPPLLAHRVRLAAERLAALPDRPWTIRRRPHRPTPCARRAGQHHLPGIHPARTNVGNGHRPRDARRRDRRPIRRAHHAGAPRRRHHRRRGPRRARRDPNSPRSTPPPPWRSASSASGPRRGPPNGLYTVSDRDDVVYVNAGSTIHAIGLIDPDDPTVGLKVLRSLDMTTVFEPYEFPGYRPPCASAPWSHSLPTTWPEFEPVIIEADAEYRPNTHDGSGRRRSTTGFLRVLSRNRRRGLARNVPLGAAIELPGGGRRRAPIRRSGWDAATGRGRCARDPRASPVQDPVLSDATVVASTHVRGCWSCTASVHLLARPAPPTGTSARQPALSSGEPLQHTCGR